MNAAAASTRKTRFPQSVFWNRLLALPRDGAFRFSVKFGLAGMLAVFAALWNKNHEPTWALFTVFVLTLPYTVNKDDPYHL